MSDPFLVHQRVLQLMTTGDVRRYLHPDFFRTRRLSGGQVENVDAGNWEAVTRDTLLQKLNGTDGTAARLVLTTDAGVGKSENLCWLEKELLTRCRSRQSFLIKLGDLAEKLAGRELSADQFLETVLTPIMLARDSSNTIGNATELLPRQVTNYLRRLALSGRLTLLFDELDQVHPASPAVRTLLNVVTSLARLPIAVGGRPYALQDCWEKLFASGDWQFFQFEGFTTQQQRTYLRDQDGHDRYEDLPEETKTELQDILTIPRVLSYLRKLDRQDFESIHTPSDIYERAIYHLVEFGLKKVKACELGRTAIVSQESTQLNISIDGSQVRQAIRILSALAWEMLWVPEPNTPGRIAEPSAHAMAPNFNRIQGASAIDKLNRAAFERLKNPYFGDSGYSTFENAVERLKSMNEAIEQGIVDSKRMEQILWRNRSLQEFLAAREICWHCTDADVDRLWQWVHLHHDARTDAFYWIWRFAAEMSDTEIDQSAWAKAMSPLYRVGDGTAEGTKRSSEMLYRTWPRMQDNGVPYVEQFLSEFQSVVDGHQGDRRQSGARHFQTMFAPVPAEPRFRMGSPDHQQGLPDDERERWAQYLRSIVDAEAYANERADKAGYVPGPRGDANRQWLRDKWLSILRGGGIEELEAWWYAKDETPRKDWKDDLASFQLNRYPTLRSWYELFDPGHGDGNRWFHADLGKRAPSGDHPVLYVNWYDVWAFCTWAYWNGQSCRLPHEDEWEKAAKAGTRWDWGYWWGDEDDPEKRTANLNINQGHTSKPVDFDTLSTGHHQGNHTNPLTFVDMLGNQLEWTADAYSPQYRREHRYHAASRVCRGGAWFYNPRDVRSAYRSGGHPPFLRLYVGFRVARAS